MFAKLKFSSYITLFNNYIITRNDINYFETEQRVNLFVIENATIYTCSYLYYNKIINFVPQYEHFFEIMLKLNSFA